ncbi:MAG: hypothetical protein O9312_03415 [Hylemonella sp.]|nr:hypothetical protein [Hylemonella sp.]
MNIDDFKIAQLNVQLTFQPEYLLWDQAGAITRDLTAIWPDIELDEISPNQQVLRSSVARITTSLSKAHIGITKLTSFDEHHDRIKRTFGIWTQRLSLKTIDQVSARAIYHFVQPSIDDANTRLIASGIAKWPSRKVFNQAEKSPKNSIGVSYQFEDESAKTIVRIRTESMKFEISAKGAIHEFEPIVQEQHRIVLDVDRIIEKSVQATDLSILDWLDGFQHLIRRDAPEFF